VKSKQDLYVITGGSKGLGKALVQRALAQNHFVVSISRTQNKDLKNSNLIQLQQDLSKSFESIEKKLNIFFKKIDFKKFRNIYFVNNAAQIEPVAEIGNLKSSDVEKHIRLNYTMPVLLTNWFLAKKMTNSGMTVFVQISSGAASFAITNWSIYCSSKAAIEMFNSVMQIQIAKSKKIKAFTYSPGIMDTGMQSVIRSLKKSDFPEVSRFKDYKKSNELRSPESVAEHLMSLMSDLRKLTEKSYSI
jgi:benzil reductase ((S)-benzoin forming)